MKNRESKSRRRPGAPNRRVLNGLEGLEERAVLAANLLASGASAIASGGMQDVTMTVTAPDAPDSGEVVLAIDVSAAADSAFVPAPLEILDSDGASVTPLYSGSAEDSTQGQATVALPPGVYTLTIQGDGETSGSYEIGVSMLGDVNADDGVGAVDAVELQAAQLAFAQEFGSGNFVSDLFFKIHGLDGDSTVDSGFDADGDGIMEAGDLAAVRQNADAGTVQVDLELDGDGPVLGNVRLVSDTGTSGADGITTSPALMVDIADNSVVASVTASINGGASVEVSSLVGDYNATGTFELDASDLEVINGGAALTAGPVAIEFVATDELGNQGDPVTFEFVLIVNNSAPTTTGISDQSADEDTAFQLDASNAFSDSDPGDVLTYAATGVPGWASLDPATGVLSGTPLNEHVGTATITLTATDSQGALVSDTFVMTVINVNDPPVLLETIGTRTATEDSVFSLNLNDFFSDPDGDTQTFAVMQTTGFDANGDFINPVALPDWLTLTNGVLSGTPDESDIGTSQVGVIVTDGNGGKTNALFEIVVNEFNDPPVVVSSIGDQTAVEDEAFSLDISGSFSDPDANDTLVFSATGLPPSFSITDAGVIQGTPVDADTGDHTVVVTVRDTGGSTASDTFELTVDNVNDAPVVSDAEFTIDPSSANGTVVGTVVATDDDMSDSLTYAISAGNADGRFAINGAGVITVADSTQLSEGATYNLTVEVSDLSATSDSAAVVIISSSNTDPVASDDSGFTVLDSNTLTIDFSSLLANDTDPDSDTLTVSDVDATSSQGATVFLSGTTVMYDPGSSVTLTSLGDGESLTDTFDYEVSDGNGGTDTASVQVQVNGVDIVRYSLSFLDADGNEVTSVNTGATFTLAVFAEDLRTDPGGPYAAYLDVNYDSDAVTVDGSIDHLTTYTEGSSGTNTTAGLLDEVGGFSSSLSPSGAGEKELFRQSFIAGANAGSVTFTSDEPENAALHATLLYGSNAAVAFPQIDFGSATLTITTPSSAAGLFYDPHDVNGDGLVTPLDVLVIVNQINGMTPELVGADVNFDGMVSPLDALLVVNNLALQSRNGTLPADDVSESALAESLTFVFEELAEDVQADPDAVAAMLLALDSPLVDSIREVLQAEGDDQKSLWDELAVELASLLSMPSDA